MPESYPIPFDEALRLKVLESYEILDSAAEDEFETLCDLVSRHFRVPFVLVSLIDRNRQWFKCHLGLEQTETPRSAAFCNYTILKSEVFCVADATQNSRFKENPLVTGSPWIRFYAGAPLVTPTGFKLGTLCLIDTQSRPALSDLEAADLQEFATMVMDKIENRRARLEGVSTPGFNAALRAIDEMQAYLSHELRAPINAMVGLAEVVRHSLARGQTGPIDDRETGSKNQQNLRRIAQIGHDVCKLADQTLNCARLDHHGLQLDEETIDLGSFCTGLFDFVREPAQEKGIEVQIHQPRKMTLYADPTKLGQMCRNLMLNAIKFTQPGGHVRLSVVRPANSALEIVVSDDGPGMAQMEIVKALTPFGQIGLAGQEQGISLGIGLPLTKRLVELHGGRLQIDTAPGHGTRIALVFPAHRVTGSIEVAG